MTRLRAIALFMTALLGLVVITPSAQAAQDITRVSVYHQAVNPIHVSGSGIGTVRTFLAPIAVDGVAAEGQYFTGTLTTLATGLKGNQEIRTSNLIFVFGEESNQLVVGGISLYPAAGETIAVGAKTVRPVVGGSGIYDGARGQLVTTNLGANGWTHVFLLDLP